MLNRRALTIVTFAASGLLAACTAEKSAPADTASSAAATSSATSGEAVPAAGGKVIVVQLVTDGTGNRFEPNKIEAHPGDLLRFTLKAGVHNVDFLPDSNPGKSGLPKASELLQLPGQTFDVPVTFAKGKYYFQCDPHALLGMTGKLEVE
jgi:plastocyanin